MYSWLNIWTHFQTFSQQAPDSKMPVEIISYWHPNLTINLMDDQTPWVQGSVPQPMDECKFKQNNIGASCSKAD